VHVTEEHENGTYWQKDAFLKKEILVSWLEEGKLCLAENKCVSI
jgi:hypothetical protein